MIQNREALKRLSVLFIDDDGAIRNVMSATLRRRFGEIYMAQNGREGLELYVKYEPDIVITDNVMPVMDGVALVKKVLEINKDQPIIMTKSFADDEHSKDCKVCATIIKPIEIEKLIEVICYSMGINCK
ncbi:response regulator [Candidatus Magnetominusculus dajiuhuensis]|uniref:response regulator n=1 Tax=Candidatus Magnetominusculus dajiuhuensis TaxID=3137712 RepID=UPI003B431B7E